jgi:hypothetical protein
MTTAHESLTLQLLEWIIERPRSYAELMDAWKTTCPRMAIWEDACAEGLIGTEPGQHGIVRVTAKGQQLCRRSIAMRHAAAEGAEGASDATAAFVIVSATAASTSACGTPSVEA